MTEGITLRAPEPSDARGMAEAWHRAEERSLVDGYPDGYPPEWFWMESVDQAEAEWIRGFLTPAAEIRTWVAERRGSPLGFSQAGPRQAGGDVGALRSLYVDPAAWGTGVGSALHDAAVDWLGARFGEAELWVIAGNVRTRRFYELHGWTDAGELTKAPNGLPLVRYVRTLRGEAV